MDSDFGSLHIFFLPFMSPGHMIPMTNMAKLFASKGVRTTIITTPLNAPIISKAIEKTKTHQSNEIQIQTIKFPSVEVGLPEGCEHWASLPSLDLIPDFIRATTLLAEPFEQLLSHQRPNCVVADWFFPWVADSAAKFGIPNLVFHGYGFFSLCLINIMRLYEPYNNTSSDDELFVIPNFPGEIKMTRLHVPNFCTKNDTGYNTMFKLMEEPEDRSYGVVVNSFYELEKEYADHYRKELGKKAWHIGPLSLWDRNEEEKAYFDQHECLKWLDTKTTNSVVYVCFGSEAEFSDSQLREIAMGLEASGQQFIWVVRKSKEDGVDEWLPEGFEKRMEGKGLIIRGWAPQVLILEHDAIGAFMNHCGWNSTLEGVTAGVPMITWPLCAEQFYNEKLVTDVLKIGVAVGVKKWSYYGEDVDIKWDDVEKAVKIVLVNEEAQQMRKRAKVLAKMATQAMEKGGSSYSDLDALLFQLVSLSH